MAGTPPQIDTPRQFARSARRHLAGTACPSIALAALAALWPSGDARAARSCDEWSAAITAVEGTAELRRSASPAWIALATGDRACSGDAIRTHSSSRVTITLPDGGTLKLDGNSSMSLPEPPSGLGSLIELLNGIIHVISRDPRQLRFATPYANAGLEGTEFDIRVDEQQRLTQVVVLEGEVVVTTPNGRLSVGSDHIAVARDGQAPTATALSSPIELMRWTSHYPPIIDRPLPNPDAEPTIPQRDSAEFYSHRAAARLATARIDVAEADIANALRIAPGHADALALSAMISLGRADRDTAREQLARALSAEPQSVVARIALSHVEQSTAALPAAADTLREAVAIEPDNAIALTRLAEIDLALGDSASAIASAMRARSRAPASSAPLVVLGFAALRAFDSRAAATAFTDAVDLEPYAPLPRLGLGLAAIQRGDLIEGRRQIELAVAFDPTNPLSRSYMAKVYDAENRGDLTTTQLELAKEFDGVDPTPWLYSSAQKLHENRAVEAFQELHAAQQRNGNRPVFRSWLALDEDVATGSSGIGRVHNELGFGRLAINDARQAIGDDPTSFAAHRLLADAYSTESRHEIARVSELLVSQLLQPANVTPIKPQLAQQNLHIAQRMGPSHTSFDEFASPVIANGLKLRASAVGGGNGISGDDITLAGLHDRVSYGAGHYRFKTDGFRDNNDLDQEVANGFIQYRPSRDTSLQAELRSARTDHGDLTTFFNREFFLPTARFAEDVDSLRLGAKHQLMPNHVLLGSLILQDVASNLGDSSFDVATDEQGASLDLQSIARLGRAIVQSGLVSAKHDQTNTTTLFVPDIGRIVEATEEDSEQLGLYSYATVRPLSTLTLTVGASLDRIEIGSTREDAFNPKLGIVWRAAPRTTVRAAAFEAVFNDLTTSSQNSQPRLEPVQLAGFTQFLLGARGDRTRVQGLAVEHEVSSELFIGWQADSRHTERSLLAPFAGNSQIEVDLQENAQQAYLYWAPSETLSFSARYEHGRYSSEPVALFGYTHMTTTRVPLELRYFARNGWTFGGRVSHVDQHGEFQFAPALSPTEPAVYAPGEDRFWVLDAFVGYRLPNRRGLLSLNADNLLDEQFQFQDVDPTNPSLFPERLVSFRFTLAFE
jgi:Tfp pilus assembly protein PilF